IDHGLEDERRHRRARIGRALELVAGFRVGSSRRAGIERRAEAVDNRVEQGRDADHARRRTAKDRQEPARDDPRPKPRLDLFGRQRTALEILLEKLIASLGDSFDEPLPHLLRSLPNRRGYRILPRLSGLTREEDRALAEQVNVAL